MSEIRVTAKNIMDFKYGVKLVEPKDGDPIVVTEIKFTTTDSPAKFTDIIEATASKVPIDITFTSNQLKFDVDRRNAENKA